MTTIIDEHENVDKVELPNGTVYLVGTAHISKESVSLAETVIRSVAPQAVAIELCEQRLSSLKDPDRWKNTDVVGAIREGRGHLLLAQLILAAFQKRLGSKIDIRPGAEMLAAAEVGEDVGATVVVVDRSIRTTLKRAWSHLGFFSAVKLFSTAVTGLLAGERINPEEVERLKQQDVLNEALREFGQVFPDVQRTLIHERDQYMAEQLRRLPAYPAVAVIGAGHIPGIKRILETGTPVDLLLLESLPVRRRIGRLLAWGIPLAVCILITIGFFKAGAGTSGQMAKAWIVSTSITGALGALMALAHPLTIVVAAIVAPFTAVNPFLRSGWIAAICEALLRRPRVMDLENILDDMTSLPGWYSNRVSRVLLVMILVNLMGIVGSILGVKALASFFL